MLDNNFKASDLKSGAYLGALSFLLVGLIIILFSPFEGLSASGHMVLGSILGALGIWIFKPGNIPYFAGSIVIIFGSVLAGVPTKVVTAGFSSPSIWLLIPAMFFGFALRKTGLGNRIAFFVLEKIKPTYTNILVGWFIIGTLFSFLTPSSTVRMLILSTVAVSIADACQLEKGSKGRSLIVISAWFTAIFIGIGWFTGSLNGPVLTGFLPAEMQAMITPDLWLKTMALPWIFITIVFLVGLFFVLRPKEKLGVTKKEMGELYKNLGQITSEERLTLIVLTGVFILLGTQGWHKIPSDITMLAGMFFLMFFKIIGVSEIGTGVNWDIIIFIGSIMGLSGVFAEAGIVEWISSGISPLTSVLAVNPLFFVLGLMILFSLLRFMDISWGYSTVALLATATPMLLNVYGINPIISLFVFAAGGGVFFLGYQQPWVALTESVIKDNGWHVKHMQKAGIIYFSAVLLAIIVFIPYWQWIGVLPK
ncbi:MAG: SLC13 family permease [Eubacteriaceae bacterium]